MKKTLSKVFAITLITLLILNIILPDQALSYSERRKLKAFPEFTKEALLDGSFMVDFEKYALDQFVFRDVFKGLKAYTELYVFRKNDINDLYLYDQHLIKKVATYRPNSVLYFANYIESLREQYLESATVYYAVIPDKNYFVPTKRYQTIDYDALISTLNKEINQMTYIDLMTTLTLEDYYLTDTHWKQENLQKVLQAMSTHMSFETDYDTFNYAQTIYDNFKGVYNGQSSLLLDSEGLTYLTWPNMDAISVINYEFPNEPWNLYMPDKLTKMDGYDVFLGGASPLIEIKNPKATTDKELIVFRDSFGSSLGPLLTQEYKIVTLVDTRYIHSSILSEFIEFDDQDVFFIYNTEVINNSQMLK